MLVGDGLADATTRRTGGFPAAGLGGAAFGVTSLALAFAAGLLATLAGGLAADLAGGAAGDLAVDLARGLAVDLAGDVAVVLAADLAVGLAADFAGGLAVVLAAACTALLAGPLADVLSAAFAVSAAFGTTFGVSDTAFPLPFRALARAFAAAGLSESRVAMTVSPTLAVSP
ncbi:hypothetical protein [Phreatobacter sp.]|uniref:hypothetical protein n=1 Tax=Phreatobacter sp. TaxID=1966341 RepID=UPI0022BBD145|nr:hypothetical protein [Phreatobacter sp.]MCZ8314988.1 hypothetical protein [Phreatobacter sp.]